MQRHSEAVGAFQQAVALQPTRVDVRFNLASSLRLLNRIPEALKYFQEVLDAEDQSKDYDALCGKADSLLALDRVAEAEQAASDAIQVIPLSYDLVPM